MDKWEWYADYHPEVELWDADWNKQVVSVETYQRVTFRARVNVDDDSEQAESVEFTDATAMPQAGGITVG